MIENSKRLLYLFLFLFFLSSITSAQEIFPLVSGGDTFRGIVPYVTTRAEVEKKLGKPTVNGPYEFKDGRVYVHYRETVCEKSDTECLCLSPVDSVLMVTVRLYYDLKVEDLKLDALIWEKAPIINGHAEGVIAYSNDKTGVTYEVRNGLVDNITYRESEDTCKLLEKKR